MDILLLDLLFGSINDSTISFSYFYFLESNNSIDRIFKLLLIGDSNVGKTQ